MEKDGMSDLRIGCIGGLIGFPVGIGSWLLSPTPAVSIEANTVMCIIGMFMAAVANFGSKSA